MIKCLIIEDEFPAREELKYFLDKNKNFVLEKEYETPLDALKYPDFQKIDVIFLDINMPELDGMNFAKIISKCNDRIKFVFITAYKEYAAEAFEIKAFDYILKPYSEKRIETVLENIAKSYMNIESLKIQKLTVQSGDKFFVVPIKNIVYIESNDKEINIFTKNGVFNTKLKMNELEEILPKSIFFRSHRSYFINMDEILEFEPWFNGTFLVRVKYFDFKIPVSRAKNREFKELLFIK